MTDLRPDEALVGILAVAATGWVIWILWRGVRDAVLPFSRNRVRRAERPAAFYFLFAFYGVSALMMTFVTLDLLFGIDMRFWL